MPVKVRRSSGGPVKHRGFIRLWGLGFRFDCSVGFWVGDGRSGTLRFRVWHTLPASALCFCCDVADKRGGLARGHLYHQLRPEPTRRGGGRFLRAIAGFMGISEGNDGGDFRRAAMARGFWPGMRAGPTSAWLLCEERTARAVVDLPSPGWVGKRHGTRGEGVASPTSRGVTSSGSGLVGASLRLGRRGMDSGSSFERCELVFDRTEGMIVPSDSCVKSKCAAFGGISPSPPREPSPPWSPSPLRAIEGEGERRTEGHVGALHPRGPLVQY